jgi:Polysaccharide biosynthesis enzyme WcbI
MSRVSLVLYGSCQCEALLTILRKRIENFESIFDAFMVTNWKYIASKQQLPDKLFHADILIYQPFKSTNSDETYKTKHVIKKITQNKPNVFTISFPFMNFQAYFPTFVSAKDLTIRPNAPFGKFPVVPKIMLDSIVVNHDDFDEIISKLHSETLIDGNIIKSISDQTFASFEIRDAECDIQLTNFIKSLWKDVRLFHSVQHPSNILLEYVADKISDIIKMKLNTDISYTSVPMDKELLQDHLLPILPCVKLILDLKFSSTQFWYKGLPVSLNDYVREFIEIVKEK